MRIPLTLFLFFSYLFFLYSEASKFIRTQGDGRSMAVCAMASMGDTLPPLNLQVCPRPLFSLIFLSFFFIIPRHANSLESEKMRVDGSICDDGGDTNAPQVTQVCAPYLLFFFSFSYSQCVRMQYEREDTRGDGAVCDGHPM